MVSNDPFSDGIMANVMLSDAEDWGAWDVIRSGVARYSLEQVGFNDFRLLSLLVREPTTRIVQGGLWGRTSFGVLVIDQFFLPPNLHGQGLGSRLLQTAEAEAVKRGCRNAMLETFTFQAPAFYARYGWQEFGRIACLPAGHFRVFMRKLLDAEATAEPN